MSDAETQVSDSGGTMVRLAGTAPSVEVPLEDDLALLADQRRTDTDATWRPLGTAPFLAFGDALTWQWGPSLDPMRVVRDDERGLVAWLAAGTEQVAWLPVDGRGSRDRPLAERLVVERIPMIRQWRGTGIVRIAPAGRPWSVWVFTEDDGTFAGHYVNLELPHLRDGGVTDTRDLILDLWLEPSGALWLKDADELEEAVVGGRLTEQQADAVRRLAERARAELIEEGDWPLAQEWTTWRPPSSWTTPTLPDDELVQQARRNTLHP